MRAWVIEEPGGPEVLQLKEDWPEPEARPGWVKIKVKAFGLNRSEYFTRIGESGPLVPFPRVLGIECVGEVVAAPDSDLKPGQKVAAAMGLMGRQYDGGYGEFTCVPRSNVYPVETDLDWEVFGALPETFLTAWGGIFEAMDLSAGQSLFIRGGTSSVGMAAATLAKDKGCTVFASTRNPAKRDALVANAVDHIVMDDGGSLADKVRAIAPDGVNACLELVGHTDTIKDSLTSLGPRGYLCIVGFLAVQWQPTEFIWPPSTVRLTMYNSEELETGYATPVMQQIVDGVSAGRLRPNIYRVFDYGELQEAHDIMGRSGAVGKLVVRTGH